METLWNYWSGHSSVFLSEQAFYFCNEEQWWHDVRPGCSSLVFGFHGNVSQQCFSALKTLPWWQGKELSCAMAAPAAGWGWSLAGSGDFFWKLFGDVGLCLCLPPHLLTVAWNPQALEDYRVVVIVFLTISCLSPSLFPYEGALFSSSESSFSFHCWREGIKRNKS